ncbi:MAG: DMT family transporter [Brumimicrobium sp.]|nr:DMT family transporter [Brumimicrobium sp.]
MNQRLTYQIGLHVIIFVWGFTAILGKWIEADAFILVWYRVLIACISLFIFMLFLNRKRRILDKKDLFRTLGVGVLVALHWLTFYLSIKVSTASLAIICLATTTIHVAWLEPLVMKRKFLWSELIIGLVILGGIFLITNRGSQEGLYIGVVFGLISALLAALFAVFNAKLIQTVSASKITLHEMLSASVIMTVFLILTGRFNAEKLLISSSDFYLLLFLGIVCTSIAFLLTVEIQKLLGAFTVALSINMEPIYTLGLAAWLLNEHEKINTYFYVGSSVILFAVFANALLKYRQTRRLKKSSQSAS